MRKTREEKAITLIALIITIVVLLILAVVAINAITGDGIIQHAVNAKTSYENAQAKEQDMIAYYETYLQTEGKAGKWVQEGSTLKTTNSDGTITKVKIGDYVDYNAGSYTYIPNKDKGAGTSQIDGSASTGYTLDTSILETEDLTWRVLGVNGKGELELISENPTSENQKLYLANDEGYVNAEDNLNNFCNKLYGQGEGASSARSLNVDDVNKLTGYNPTEDSTYGNKWTYKYPTTEEVNASTTGLTNNIWYKTVGADGTLITDWTNITRLEYRTFRLPEETTAISSANPGSKEVIRSSYGYLIPEDGYTTEEEKEIANIITKGTTNENITQWLASRSIFCQTWRVRFGVINLLNGKVNNDYLFESYESFGCCGYRVRPVVSLSSEVSLTGSGDDIGSLNNMWQIS